VVFFQDECHLLWGDLCGYIWGKTSERNQEPRRKLTGYESRSAPEPKDSDCRFLSSPQSGGESDTYSIEVPILNERERQTYYGAVNLRTQECLLQNYDKGNSQSTIAFVDYLLKPHPNRRIALFWDGASYHRSRAFRDYLSAINQGLDESAWKVTCVRFAPNDPKQNPIEDIWLQAKRFIRAWYHLCKSFRAVKALFEFATHRQIFDFPKLFTYGFFSQMI
jgi:transposase